ncbi:MAG: TolC family protein [Rhodocyclaceae bacterium]|nr:TolC family protein [Rhodocyclaceae bacterium]
MIRRKLIAAALLAALPLCAIGAETSHPELPPTDAAVRVLRDFPPVQAAGHLLRAQEANRDKLVAGPHEWNLRLTRQQREVPSNPTQRYPEWDASLERAVRLPGKGALDASLGAAGVAFAELGQGDALHEASRLLLTHWFEWLRQKEALSQCQAQVRLLERQSRSVQRRVELGDASRIEAAQSGAALAQAAAQLAQAKAREAASRIELSRRFPGLPLPENTPDTLPGQAEGRPESWREAILAHNHELGMARAESLRARLEAQRSDKERMPDPTIGLRMGRERGGEEHVAGLTLSFPLPGAARDATGRIALAQADAATAREAAILRKVEAEAEALEQNVRAQHAAWLDSKEAAERQGEAADMMARAYTLGEGSLADMLMARRLAFEARLSAQLARLTALEYQDRLLLDAHKLWPLDMND